MVSEIPEQEQVLLAKIRAEQERGAKIPSHIGFILDGNRRWAKQHGLSSLEGHRQGYKTVEDLLDWALEMGIESLTLYAFSTENFKRSPEEVTNIMALLLRGIKELSEDPRLWNNKVRVRFIGNRVLLNDHVVEAMEGLEAETSHHDRFNLNIAVAYGGRDEIVRAVREICREVASGKLEPEKIDDFMISARLDTKEVSDPDLIIRTSGEQRISGFLTWQATYAEFIFQPMFLPEYKKYHFLEALYEFQTRQRRFGQ